MHFPLPIHGLILLELGVRQDMAWQLYFDSVSRESHEYAGIDSQLRMRLTTLFFFCNRPTVGALIAMGSDLSAAFNSGTSESRSATEIPARPGPELEPMPSPTGPLEETPSQAASDETRSQRTFSEAGDAGEPLHADFKFCLGQRMYFSLSNSRKLLHL